MPDRNVSSPPFCNCPKPASHLGHHHRPLCRQSRQTPVEEVGNWPKRRDVQHGSCGGPRSASAKRRPLSLEDAHEGDGD
jgi:hypothetical protein